MTTVKRKKPKAPKVEVETNGRAWIEWDVTDAPDMPSEGVPTWDGPDLPPGGANSESFEAGSFGARVTARRRDLVQLLVEGVPPIEFLAASDGLLARGKRHLLAAPRKTGKSISMLSHWCDMIQAGSSGVVVLDRENGAEEYARRLAGIFKHKSYTADEIAKVRGRLHYFEFPQIKQGDAEDFATSIVGLGADIVVFDSQRMFLTDLGLKEDVADDYSTFMKYVVDPLFSNGITTLILDNTGHGDKSRSRGTSGKGDLNEVLLVMKAEVDFDLFQKGRVKLEVSESRVGSRGEWTMEIGGGVFGSWMKPDEEKRRPDFREAVGAVLASSSEPLGANKVLDAVREGGLKIRQRSARALLAKYADDPADPIRRAASERGGYEIESKK